MTYRKRTLTYTSCQAPLVQLDEADLDRDPLRQFESWFEAARETGVRAPEAMALATATPDGAPSARMVLLKGVDEHGLVFFTSYESRKGRELEANPRAALLFYWEPLGRQVRVEGPLERAVEALPHDAPRPDWWGGYRVRPERYEFWQHRENRLHDRFLYERDGEAWRILRLNP